MVHTLRIPAVVPPACRLTQTGKFVLAVLMCLGIVVPATAQRPKVHYRHSGDMPPGAIGQRQLLRGGPLPGYYQPAEISAPAGVTISLAREGGFDRLQRRPRRAAMLIGQVYRFKVANIPLHAGIEVFPTIEVIDRLYPPLGKEALFPIPIQITQNDLAEAAKGRMVTRVIYLEDPQIALPIREFEGRQNWLQSPEGDDPLRFADTLGRPVAILRMGARVPGPHGPDHRFLFGSPAWIPISEMAMPAESLPAPPPGAAPVPGAAPPTPLPAATTGYSYEARR